MRARGFAPGATGVWGGGEVNPPREDGLRQAFYGLALAILIGWLLVTTKDILLPILVALLVAFVIDRIVGILVRVPGLRRLPGWLLTAASALILIATFILSVEMIAARAVALSTTVSQDLPVARDKLASLPGIGYLVERLEAIHPLAELDIGALAVTSLEEFGGILEMLLLASLLALFLMLERPTFPHRLSAAVPEPHLRHRIGNVLAQVDRRIGRYVAAKTLVNAILGAVTAAVLLAFGLPHAILLAALVAILNFIPYLGAAAGIALPVLLALAEFDGVASPFAMAAVLLVVHGTVASIAEPLVFGRTFGLSPLAVLLALLLWTAIWGLAGTVLAVPLTSILMIVLAEFDATRPVAILAMRDPSE